VPLHPRGARGAVHPHLHGVVGWHQAAAHVPASRPRVTPAPLLTAWGVAHPAFPKPEPAPQLEPKGARLRQRGRTPRYSASAERGGLVEAGEVLQASRRGGREKLCLNGFLSNGAVQSATMADTACKAKRARYRIGRTAIVQASRVENRTLTPLGT
jgi:hypothetical protein